MSKIQTVLTWLDNIQLKHHCEGLNVKFWHFYNEHFLTDPDLTNIPGYDQSIPEVTDLSPL